MREKLSLYERVGVREYWIVHPVERTVMVFLLSGEGSYGKPEVYGGSDEMNISIFDKFIIDLKKIFPL